MLSHAPQLRFDSRFTASFFQKIPASRQLNFGRLKKDALRTMLFSRLGSSMPGKLYVGNLINCFADLFGYEKNIVTPEIPPENEAEFLHIKNTILDTLKREFTFEFFLYYIIEKKFAYSEKLHNATPDQLSKALPELYNSLDIFGPDNDFIKSSSHQISQQDDFERFSILLISLMLRLQKLNFVTLNGTMASALNENTIAYVIPHCSTMTFIYVEQGGQRKSLITFLREGHQAHCENIFSSNTALTELFASIKSLEEREKIWSSAFTPGKLGSALGTPVEFENVLKLLPETSHESIREQYQSKTYLNLDKTFVPAFFSAVSNPDDGELAEFLTRVRRANFVKMVVALCKENGFADSKGGYALANRMLNIYADELGVIKSKETAELDDLLVLEAAQAFKEKVAQSFNLQYFIEFLYASKVKNPLTASLKSVTADNFLEKHKEIETLFDFYGFDKNFKANIFFDEEAAYDGDIVTISEQEIELRSYLTLMSRLESSGFINTDFKQILHLDDGDYCYIMPGNGVLLAYAVDTQNNIPYPLVTYFLKQGNDVVCQILLQHPILLPILNYFPVARRDSFYLQNNEILPHLIVDPGLFIEVVKKFNNDQRKEVLQTCDQEYLQNFTQSKALFNALLAIVPNELHETVTETFSVEQLQNVLVSQDDFIFYINRLTPLALQNFISRLDRDYLQNLFQGIDALRNLVMSIPQAVIPGVINLLGDAFLKIYLPNTQTLFEFAQNVSTQVFRVFCHSLSDGLLRYYFADSASLGLVSCISGERLTFLTRLINLTCPAYKDLFINHANLRLVLAQVGDDETELLESIEINYSPSITDCKQLVSVLQNFNKPATRLSFCQRFEEYRFSTIITTFAHLLEIFNYFEGPTFLEFFKSYEGKFFANLITTPQHVEALLSAVPMIHRQELFTFLEWQPWFQKNVPDRKTYLYYKNSLSTDNQEIFSTYETRVEKFEAQIIIKKIAEIQALEARITEVHWVYAMFKHNNHVYAARELSQRAKDLSIQITTITIAPFASRLAAHEKIYQLMMEDLELTFERYLSRSCNGFFSKQTPVQLVEKMNDDAKNFHFLRLSGLLLNDLYHQNPSLPVSNGLYYRKILKKLVGKIVKPEKYDELTIVGAYSKPKEIKPGVVLRTRGEIRRGLRA